MKRETVMGTKKTVEGSEEIIKRRRVYLAPCARLRRFNNFYVY